jgi:AcrR family transcriptional regulator
MARPVKIEEKRQELLDKAVTVFSRYGYSKTTLDDVAKKTGINKASLYHYFKNKKELFLQVMLLVSSRGIEELKKNALRLKTPEKQLVFYFSERLHFYLQIVRLNSLSKETLLHLQVIFDSVYQPVKENEIEWIAALLFEIVPSLTKKQSAEYARQLFYIKRNKTKKMTSTALITGASGGIGWELAKKFAENSHNLVLVARSEGKLKELAAQLEQQYKIKVTVIAKDLSDYNTAKEIFDGCTQQNIQIDYLVNNAGIGHFGFFHESDWKTGTDNKP